MTRPEARADFWSRRRAAVQAEEAAETEAEALARAEAEAEERRIAQEARDDADILAEFDLPDPDDLQPGQDIAGFMQSAIPERLRLRAMRRLWRINPVLANLDKLVDHGEDYTDAATVSVGMKTSYQVGKGLMKHVEALAREAGTGAGQVPTRAGSDGAGDAADGVGIAAGDPPAPQDPGEDPGQAGAVAGSPAAGGAPAGPETLAEASVAPDGAGTRPAADPFAEASVAPDGAGTRPAADPFAEAAAPRPRRMRFDFAAEPPATTPEKMR